MPTLFRLHNNRLELTCSDTDRDDQLTLTEAQCTQMQALQKRYQERPIHDPEQAYLKKLGEDLYQWLNQRLWLDQLLDDFLPT
ncbi:MAG TPA: hypothetical protein ENK78_06940, partial [Thiothrix sp.]|nr:hypothetical protein [Thiothrix sp.]